MLEVEIQNLTAAIKELIVELRSANETPAEKSYREDNDYREGLQAARDKAVEDRAPKKSSPKKVAVPEPEAAPAPAPAPSRDITAEDLKTVAMELARADNSARASIIQILADHDSKTIPHLDPKHYNSVHGALLKLAKTIYDKSEEV